jgi:hypothetical protein
VFHDDEDLRVSLNGDQARKISKRETDQKEIEEAGATSEKKTAKRTRKYDFVVLISIFVKATSAIPVLYDGCCCFIIECSLFCPPKKWEKHFNYERKIGKKRRRREKKGRSQLQTNNTRGNVEEDDDDEEEERM